VFDGTDVSQMCFGGFFYIIIFLFYFNNAAIYWDWWLFELFTFTSSRRR